MSLTMRALVLGILLCLFAAGVWLLSWGGAAAQVETVGGDRLGGVRVAATDGPRDVATPARTELSPDVELALHVTVQGSDLETGRVGFLCTSDPLVPGSGVLGSEVGSAATKISHAELRAGRAVLRVERGRWTWLRLEARGAERRMLVEPLQAAHRLDIDIEAGKPHLHVFVLAHDYSGPAAGASVDVYLRDMRAGGAPRRITRVTTDRWGHVNLPVGDPGLYLVVPSGLPLNSQPPQRASFVHVPNALDRDYLIKIVQPRPTAEVEFAVVTAARPGASGPIALYLERLGPGRLYYPIAGPLHKGRSLVRCRVPAGRYRLSALPLGVFGASLRDDIIDVFPAVNARRTLNLIEQSRSCEVELRGVPPQAFPVTVTLRRSEDLRCDPNGGTYVGSFRWHTARDRVHALRCHSRLDVAGRGQYFVSREPVDLSAETNRVSFRAACLVDVQVSAPNTIRTADLVLFCESDLGRESARLRNELLSHRYGGRVLRRPQFLLPRGSAHLVVWHADWRRILGRQEIRCSQSMAVVRIDLSGE